jgi:hypothetical protein
MKTQYTPAPWDIFPKDDTLEIGNYGTNAPLVRLSATVPANDWEGWANARLIASAPDLLQVVEDYLLLCQLHDWVGAVPDAARAAIAKAKG